MTNRVKGYKNKSKFSCRLFLQLWVLLQLAKPLVHLLEELPFSKFVFIFLLVFNELQSWAKWNCQVQPFLTYKNGHFIWSNVTLWLEDLKGEASVSLKRQQTFFFKEAPGLRDCTWILSPRGWFCFFSYLNWFLPIFTF